MNRAPFKTIFFDIAGTCNARCTYCNTGKFAESKGGFISAASFEKAIDSLLDQQLLSTVHGVNLYCWGEPFLHPKLSELLEILNKRNIPYRFSTNGSRLPTIDKDFVRGLDGIVFSMSGFSQASYTKIHGFKFADIITNIESVVSKCRKHGYKGRFTISYHTYQFNMGELFMCEKFAKKNSIDFRPVNAIQNNWTHIEENAQGKLPHHLKDSITRDLIYDNFSEIVELAKNPVSDNCFKCPYIDEMLVIDESCNVLQCCQVPSGISHSPGNLLESSWTDISQNRTLEHDVCQRCMSLGMAQYFQAAYKEPDFYKAAILARPTLSDYLDPRYWSRKYPKLRLIKGQFYDLIKKI